MIFKRLHDLQMRLEAHKPVSSQDMLDAGFSQHTLDVAKAGGIDWLTLLGWAAQFGMTLLPLLLPLLFGQRQAASSVPPG